MFVKLVPAVASLFFATTAIAADLGAAVFDDMRIRPANGPLAVGFFTVTAPTSDAIVKVSSDCCKALELHRTEKLNGVMSMRRIAELNLKKGAPFSVQPEASGGEHLMLIGLKKPLAEGDTVKVTFTFKKAGSQTVTFPVQADGKESAHHAH